MRYQVLVTDYDGTLARGGSVSPATVAALERLKTSGRQLVLATGRRLEDLVSVFPAVELFDRVVAENGAVLHRPARHETVLLAEPPPPVLVEALQARGVPLSVGHVVVATIRPHETAVLKVLHGLGLGHQLTFNKGAVMVLPAGTTKGSALAPVLDELGLSPHNAVGVGDAENDYDFLGLCEAGVAVANALPMLRQRVDLVTRADHGEGVQELVAAILADDLAGLVPRRAPPA